MNEPAQPGSGSGPRELIRLENISKTYRPGEVDIPVLRGVSLVIEHGELVALMGASGSGKTTLMNILGCLDRATAGRYWLDGEDISALSVDQRADVRSQKIGFVFQNYNLLARTSALDNALLPLECAHRQTPQHEMMERAGALLSRVGLADQLTKEPSQMSGGQQQRVAIARALINRPTLLLADEPTGNLDSKTSAEILQLFQELNAEGVTILLVTHDPEVARHARRVITIRDGRIVDGGTTETPARVAVSVLPAPPSAGSAGITAQVVQSHSKSRWLPRSLSTAITALRRNLMRSALTALGIIIGIAAVIAMMEVGQDRARPFSRTLPVWAQTRCLFSLVPLRVAA